MSQVPPGDNDVSGTPPWERPRRWTQRRLDAERVDDLLARLGAPDSQNPRPRHHRRAEEVSSAPLAADESLQLSGPPVDGSATASAEPLVAPDPAPITGYGEPTDVIAAVPSFGDENQVNLNESDSQGVSALGDDAPSKPAKTKATTEHHPMRTSLQWTGRSVVALVSVLLLIATGVYWNSFNRFEKSLASRQVDGVVTTDTNITEPTKKPEPGAPAPKYAPENWLLIGSDTRAGAINSQYDDPDKPMEAAQADTMMIAHLPADRKQISVLSLPRDMRVSAPDDCYSWNYKTGKVSDKRWQVSPTERWKLTNAYAVGGPQCSVRAIQKLTGIRIDRVIIIDFAGFRSMVDALGGITLDICRPIDDVQLGLLVDKTGPQHINGELALSIVRARKVKGDKESDPARVRRQQVVLSTMLRQLTSAGTLLNPAELDRFLQAFANATSTSNVTMSTLLDLARSLGSLSPESVTFYTAPVAANGLLVEQQARPMFNALINDEQIPAPGAVPSQAGSETPPASSLDVVAPATPLAASSAAPSPTTPSPAATPAPIRLTVAPADIKLQIENATGRKGVAGTTRTKVNALGFTVTDSDLLLIERKVTTGITVDYAPGQIAAAFTVAAAFPGATIRETSELTGWQVRVVLGSDYDGSVASAVRVGDEVPTALVPESMRPTTPPAAPTPTPVPSTSTPTTPPSMPTPAAPAPAPPTAKVNPSDLHAINANDRQCV